MELSYSNFHVFAFFISLINHYRQYAQGAGSHKLSAGASRRRLSLCSSLLPCLYCRHKKEPFVLSAISIIRFPILFNTCLMCHVVSVLYVLLCYSMLCPLYLLSILPPKSACFQTGTLNLRVYQASLCSTVFRRFAWLPGSVLGDLYTFSNQNNDVFVLLGKLAKNRLHICISTCH